MRCVGSLYQSCADLPEPGGARCASCARWAARELAEEQRDRAERAAAADAAWVAAVTDRHAGQGWRCTPECVPCDRGLGYRNAEPYLLEGRLFDHARRPAPAVRVPALPVGQLV